MTSEDFYGQKIIDITITKSSFIVLYNMIFDSVKSGRNMLRKNVVEQRIGFDKKRDL